jgi:hypothetical protein
LRSQRPDHACYQLVSKVRFAIAIVLQGIAVRSDNVPRSDACAQSEGPVGCKRKIIGRDTHKGADGNVTVRVGDYNAAYTGRFVHAIRGVTGFHFKAQAIGPFVARRTIESGGILKADIPTGATNGAIQECDLGVEFLQIAPTGTETEIKAVAGGGCRRDKSEERHARKGNGSEFHFNNPHP